jgi:hypothetical protein
MRTVGVFNELCLRTRELPNLRIKALLARWRYQACNPRYTIVIVVDARITLPNTGCQCQLH